MRVLAARSRRLALFGAAIALLAGALAAPASAYDPPPLRAGMTYNVPGDRNTPEMLVNLRKMMVAIDGTKSGETIRMAFFSLTVWNFSDKLIEAYNRGVNVRLIQDDHEIGPMWQDLVDKLGSDTTKKSWAVVCHRSCHSDENPSYMHAKIYLFSKTKSLSKVTMVCSCNPTYTQARVGWNDMYTWIGDTTIYDGGVRYFEDLTAGAVEDAEGNQTHGIPQDNYFTVASGKNQMYFFPKTGEGPEEDPAFQMLRDVECIGTSAGYGSLGRTVIKVAMYQWSVRRDRIAHRLWDLSQDGCWVDIVYDQTATDKEVIDVLKTPGEGVYPIPTLTKSSMDKNDDGDFKHYVDIFNHEKYVLINGIYEGDKSTKFVISGTANWTNTALQYGNEITFTVEDNSVYADYHEQFQTMKSWARSLPTSWLASGPFPSDLPGGGGDEDARAALADLLGESRNELLPTERE
jgi:phosphatidylserine/phosphatidylglycerophosphate/cardiolipin synthase-like enzyme